MRWRPSRPHCARSRRARLVRVLASPTDVEVVRLSGDLHEARDMIAQLQRELERARGVIADQQLVLQRAAERGGTNRGNQ